MSIENNRRRQSASAALTNIAAELKGRPLPTPTLRTAHEVRHLVTCAYAKCRALGDKRNMIAVKNSHYHGRCYIRRFSYLAFLQLPRAELAKLTLGDVGVTVMRAIIG
jgi:hypothetical protein